MHSCLNQLCRSRFWCLIASAILVLNADRLQGAPGPGMPISFAQQVRPILNTHCVACHGGVKRAGDISFIVRESAVATEGTHEAKPIRPAEPHESEFLRRITASDPSKRMPPPEHGPALSMEEVETLRQWIAQGAEWEDHWAFVHPKAVAAPSTKMPWGMKELDKFVLARIEAAGLYPSKPASRRSWLRRVTFDLTGLPPTLGQIRDFERDTSTGAKEAVVDRLLRSPEFGERWASVWLDLARYADSMGFEKDPHRPIWPWRDWVIRALNENMPFDEFTIRQLAGDLLPGGTLEDRLATAFHRNTQTNTEGGTDDEEYRTAAVLDRVNTVFEAWQGVTFRCAQCHAHPYEPIEQHEYFEVKAFFNNTRDWDLGPEYPLLNVPTNPAEVSTAADLDRRISKLRQNEFAMTSALASNEEQWIRFKPQKADSTHATRLVISADGEIRTAGTVAHFSRFTLEIPLSSAESPIQAIRLEALPLQPTEARLNPEIGFVISRFRAAIPADGVTNAPVENEKKIGTPLDGEITFARAFGDEAEPFRDSDSALDPDKAGWGAWPRITRPRSIVFVPNAPVPVSAGGILKVVIHHDEGPGDAAALVMNRFRLSYSTNQSWAGMLEETQESRAQIRELTAIRGGIKGTPVPVLQENEPQHARPTAVFVRGNWLEKAQEVSAGVPRIYRLASGSPTNRLQFAKWLVSSQNPLTSRVVVNRFWEQMFGRGLVETLEDFGSSGQAPSHPELLDYVALRFQDEWQWDVRKLLREIVLSATYAQDSTIQPEGLNRDPQNLLLARGPRTRLSAEMVRDQALAVSGLLSGKMFGPPVMPPQPEGIWRAAYSGEKWTTSEGEDRYRRAIYTYIRRTAGYPSFQTFDAPSRDICTARRLRTNTPLQALVTLNDPVYVEAAVALARRMRDETSGSLSDQIRYGFELVTSHIPKAGDLHDLLELHGFALAAYNATPEDARPLAGTAEMAALIVLANTLLNLDQALIR
jgi:hypothetical protein